MRRNRNTRRTRCTCLLVYRLAHNGQHPLVRVMRSAADRLRRAIIQWTLVSCCEFPLQLQQRKVAYVAFRITQPHTLAENVIGDHLLLANARHENPAFLGKALATLHIELVLETQAAHEPSARTRNLRRVQRKPLVLGNAQVDREKLRQPGRRAVLASASANSGEPPGLIANANLLELDPRT